MENLTITDLMNLLADIRNEHGDLLVDVGELAYAHASNGSPAYLHIETVDSLNSTGLSTIRKFAEGVIQETEKDVKADAFDMVWQLDQWHNLIKLLDGTGHHAAENTRSCSPVPASSGLGDHEGPREGVGIT